MIILRVKIISAGMPTYWYANHIGRECFVTNQIDSDGNDNYKVIPVGVDSDSGDDDRHTCQQRSALRGGVCREARTGGAASAVVGNRTGLQELLQRCRGFVQADGKLR